MVVTRSGDRQHIRRRRHPRIELPRSYQFLHTRLMANVDDSNGTISIYHGKDTVTTPFTSDKRASAGQRHCACRTDRRTDPARCHPRQCRQPAIRTAPYARIASSRLHIIPQVKNDNTSLSPGFLPGDSTDAGRRIVEAATVEEAAEHLRDARFDTAHDEMRRYASDAIIIASAMHHMPPTR